MSDRTDAYAYSRTFGGEQAPARGGLGDRPGPLRRLGGESAQVKKRRASTVPIVHTNRNLNRRRIQKAIPFRGLLGSNMEHEQSLSGLVGNLHAPIPFRREFSVDPLESLSGCHCRFLPCRVHVRQLLAYRVDLRMLMCDVEEVPWHGERMHW